MWQLCRQLGHSTLSVWQALTPPMTALWWWRHQMETFCEGNSLVTGGFLSQRPVVCSFDGFFDLRWANDGDAGDLRRHRDHHDVTAKPRCRLALNHRYVKTTSSRRLFCGNRWNWKYRLHKCVQFWLPPCINVWWIRSTVDEITEFFVEALL